MSNKKITCPECKSDNIKLIEMKGSFSTYKCLECKNKFDVRVFIQISLSQEEKDNIKEYAKQTHSSMSNFIRDAIFRRIENLENPKDNQTNNLSQINPGIIEELKKDTKRIIELQELTLERTNLMNEMNNTLRLIKKFSIKADSTAKDTIINLFKAHNTLTPKDIIDKTKLDKEIVFSIISELHEADLIELTPRGKYKWK